ncbi:MAG: DNA repair protein RadC [Deltaproteobacteria bacterium]|nr:DNA repair protein RadC [Deltaproteobacteria bacterium]
MGIGAWPVGERPREKMVAHGARALSDAELIAILLRSGTRGQSACDVARELLTHCSGLHGLMGAELDEVATVPGVGRVKAVILAAAMELARRWATAQPSAPPVLDSSEALFMRYHPQLRSRGREHFVAVALDGRHRLLREQWVSAGDRGSAVVPVRELFAAALACRAGALAVLHNHPSGDAAPSADDHHVTEHLAAAGRFLDIPLLDHLIIGDSDYFSFRDAGLLG